MLVFAFNDKQNGSYIDPISGTAGTNTNGVWKRTEKGLAWEGDGSSSEVDCGNESVVNITGNLSISCWVKFDSTIGWRSIVSKGLWNTAYGLLNVNGIISFNLEGITNVQSASILSEYTWYHIVATYNTGSGSEIYLNGVSVKTSATTGSISTSAANLIVGSTSNGSYPFDGVIGNVRIYNHTLTTREVSKLYNEFLHAHPKGESIVKRQNTEVKRPVDLSNESGLVAGYNFIPHGDTLVDISGNGNDFTINGDIQTGRDGMLFNATAGCLNNIAFSTELTGAFTAAMRVKINDGVGVYQSFFSKGGTSIYTRKNTSEKIEFQVYDGTNFCGATTTVNFPSNIFCDIVLSFDGNTAILYLNGVQVSTDTEAGFTTINAGNMYIGERSGNGAMDGIITDTRFYNYAWTQQQAEDYHSSFARKIIFKEDFYNDPVGATI